MIDITDKGAWRYTTGVYFSGAWEPVAVGDVKLIAPPQVTEIDLQMPEHSWEHRLYIRAGDATLQSIEMTSANSLTLETLQKVAALYQPFVGRG